MCRIRIEKRERIDELIRCGWEIISVRACEEGIYVILGRNE